MAKSNGTKNKAPTDQERLVSYTVNELKKRTAILDELGLNASLSRQEWVKSIEGDIRDINKECGYPETANLNVHKYYKPLYERHPLASRVVQFFPLESWKVAPEVFEDEEADSATAFEVAWEELSLSLSGGSKFKGTEEGNPVWEVLKRADILSGIGRYGVIFLGLDDGKDPSEPAERREGQQLLFMRVFDESQARISDVDRDITSPRHGEPVFYDIEFENAQDVSEVVSTTTESTTRKVHWTRVVHIADNRESNEIYGVPRMRPVFNPIWDSRKIYGASGEGYFKGAFPGVFLETHPELGTDAIIDDAALKEAMEDYENSLKRWQIIKGAKANQLAPQVSDPGPPLEVHIDAICIEKGWPKRIFMGSERGELASSQDKKTWNERVEGRNNSYVTPRIVVRTVDRLIFLGILPEPQSYGVKWPDQDLRTEEEKANVAVKKVEALVKYIQGDGEAFIAPLDFLVRFLEVPPEEAEAILEAAIEHLEENPPEDPPNASDGSSGPPMRSEDGEIEEE